MGDLIRLNNNPQIIYELKPNIKAKFVRVLISTNKNGFRGRVIPSKKGKKSVRIIGLGDSVMFGWGVEEGKDFMSVLAEELQKFAPQCDWEIVNTGVPGYTTLMEVATLEEKGLAYSPDVVILNFINNDLELPSFIREQVNYFSLKTSFMYDYFKSKKKPHEDSPLTRADIANPDRPYSRNIPAKYRSMQGEAAFTSAMRRLKELSIQHNFEVVVISYMGKLMGILEENCKKNGFPLIYPANHWETYAANHDIPDSDKAWRLSDTDKHPSVIGHQFLAHLLFEHITTNMEEPLCPVP